MLALYSEGKGEKPFRVLNLQLTCQIGYSAVSVEGGIEGNDA